jgi:hypothetical protein
MSQEEASMMQDHRAHGLIRAFVRAEESMAGENPAAMVDMLRHALPAHFEAEERVGGIYDDLAARGVSVPLLARFRADHRSFLAALDALAARAEDGEDICDALWALAHRIRVHERREAASAIQVGTACCGVPAPLPGPSGRDTVAEVVRQAVANALEVPGRLIAGVVVNVGDVTGTLAQWAVEDALAAAGLEIVDVRVTPDGPAGLQHTDFESVEEL